MIYEINTSAAPGAGCTSHVPDSDAICQNIMVIWGTSNIALMAHIVISTVKDLPVKWYGHYSPQ